MTLEPYSETERAILDAFHRMDRIEQTIFLTGLRAMESGRFTPDEFEAWSRERIDRHRAGEELMLEDLEIPDVAA